MLGHSVGSSGEPDMFEELPRGEIFFILYSIGLLQSTLKNEGPDIVCLSEAKSFITVSRVNIMLSQRS